MAITKRVSPRTVREDIYDGAEQFPVVVKLAAHAQRRIERRRPQREPRMVAA